jgi:hypothetical protein
MTFIFFNFILSSNDVFDNNPNVVVQNIKKNARHRKENIFAKLGSVFLHASATAASTFTTSSRPKPSKLKNNQFKIWKAFW